ncbi:MAG TPA: hypothetical protein PKA41_09930, partial [Verrucomicrobiota bacterium]|nr:hypothetical protein [Verrucomicrobiota bacterium]
DKINVNYVNVDARGKVNHNLATNFTVWRAEKFFTNAADRLVRLYSQDWVRTERTNFIRNFNVQDSFALTNIPVWISNRFVYSPSIHRLMQVTANIYDVQTNRVYQAVNPGQNTQPYLPSVFRPKFRREVQAGSYTNLYISGFVEVAARDDHDDVRRRPTFDLNRVADRNVLFNTLTESALSDVNIYGVPIVIGAKKGLPNFNKFALETVSQITRKLELRRLTADSPVNRTNTMYLVSVSNVVAAVEVWNSYATNYTRGVGIFASNDMSICLVVTNENGPPTVRSLDVGVSGSTFIAANDWPARASKVSSRDTAVAASFRVPLNTNIFFLPTSVYRPASRTFQPASDAVFDGPEFYQPRFYLTVTNRLRFYMTDEATGRIIDYVHLNDLDTKLNLSDVIADDNNALGAKGLWITNRSGGNSVLNPTEGILNQLEVSLGNVFISDALWRDEGGIGNRDDEQNKFKAFINGTGTAGGDSLVAQAPYNASAKISQLMIWQANDPLVHYTAADLQNPAAGNGIQPLSVASAANTLAMTSKLNVFNDRYEPWGRDGGIVSTVPAYKDPMIRSSDDWDFPTNKLPNVGWLGRVHRGTPWQTIYMKSGDVLANANDFKNWRLWSGHTRLFELTNMAPRADRLLFDVFTAAVNENATRGQLSVNQQGPAAWSAVLSGVVVLTNTHPDPAKDKTPLYEAKVINPAGPNTNSATWRMIKGIQRQRERQVVIEQPQRATNDAYPGRAFAYVGDILSVPELTDQSPFLNRPTGTGLRERIRNYSLDDAAYERIPQQIMGLLRVDDEPRFTIYAFGQALKPAPRSIITSGNQFGLCTNYQVTAEMATRTVVRVKGAPRPGDAVGATPEVLVERFNVLGPD